MYFFIYLFIFFFFFFFQAEDGIRDTSVTGVQTCALPIYEENLTQRWQGSDAAEQIGAILPMGALFVAVYRGLPGLKRGGDRLYAFVRDNRYRQIGRASCRERV